MSRRRKIWVGLAALVTLAIAAMLTVGGLVRARPSWYRPEPLAEEVRRAAAKSLQDRIVSLNNRVGDSIIESKQQSTPARPVEIEITEEELNAVYQTWEVLPGLDDQLDRFVTDRRIRLLPDRIVLAGKLERGGIVAGLHLVVQHDDKGLPIIFLEGINAGLVHLPESMTNGARRRMIVNLERDVATRTRHAKLDPPNDDAIRVVVARQLARIASGGRVQPLLVVQSGLGDGLVAEPAFARLEKLEISDGKLTANLRPLDEDESREACKAMGIIIAKPSP